MQTIAWNEKKKLSCSKVINSSQQAINIDVVDVDDDDDQRDTINSSAIFSYSAKERALTQRGQ